MDFGSNLKSSLLKNRIDPRLRIATEVKPLAGLTAQRTSTQPGPGDFVYETFYRLDGKGFRQTQDYRRKFSHASYAAAAKTLLDATTLGQGFVVLTGAPGTGKSTLVWDFAAQVERDGYFVGKVANSQVDADDLLRLIGFAFGLQADSFTKAGLWTTLKDHLSAKSPSGKPAILIIDEAQNLSLAALEDLCLLCRLPVRDGPILQILLAGQARFWERLQRPDHESILQLVVASCRLNPLSASETRGYIAHSLKLVGWRGDPEISADALRLIHVSTGGVLRLINLTVSHLLLYGSSVEAHRLEADDVESVLKQLGKVHPDLVTNAEPLQSQSVLSQPLQPLDARAAEDTASRSWKWAFTGLSSAAIAACIVVFLSVEAKRSVPLESLEPNRGQQTEIAPTAPRDPPAVTASHGHQESAADRPADGVSIPITENIEATPPDGVAADNQDMQVPAQREVDAPLAKMPPGGVEADDQDTQVPAQREVDAPLAKMPPGGVEADDQDTQVPAQREVDASLAKMPPGSVVADDQGTQIPAQREVDTLLAKAAGALSRNRLTAPPGDNAHAYYRAVLARDPANAQARTGVQRIVHRYRELAQQRLKRGDLEGARQLTVRGLKISPQDRGLLDIERRAARPAATKSNREVPDVLERLVRWFRSGKTNGPFLDH